MGDRTTRTTRAGSDSLADPLLLLPMRLDYRVIEKDVPIRSARAVASTRVASTGFSAVGTPSRIRVTRHTERRTEIWFMYIEGRVFITGSPGPRDWYANMVANPEFTFHLKESARVDLAAHAAPVTDPEERRRVMSAPETEWYRGVASMEELVARSPMVEVFLD